MKGKREPVSEVKTMGRTEQSKRPYSKSRMTCVDLKHNRLKDAYDPVNLFLLIT